MRVENWCKVYNRGKEIWDRRLPNKSSQNEEEAINARALGYLKKKLKKYEGIDLEEIEYEEYRKILEIVRRIDEEYNTRESLQQELSQAKKQRDEAKTKNNQAKELEQQVSDQLKKRGKEHEEQ